MCGKTGSVGQTCVRLQAKKYASHHLKKWFPTLGLQINTGSKNIFQTIKSCHGLYALHLLFIDLYKSVGQSVGHEDIDPSSPTHKLSDSDLSEKRKQSEFERA